MKVLFSLIALAASIMAQVNFTASSGTITIRPGQSGQFDVSIGGTTGAAGVQWSLASAPAGVALTSTTAIAGKEINCTATGTKCVVSGMNANVIPAGTVATTTVSVAVNVPPGLITLPFSGFVAATPTGSGATIGTTPVDIKIRVLSPKDLNGDGVTDHGDFLISVDQILGAAPCTTADLNSDSVCDVRDLVLLVI